MVCAAEYMCRATLYILRQHRERPREQRVRGCLGCEAQPLHLLLPRYGEVLLPFNGLGAEQGEAQGQAVVSHRITCAGVAPRGPQRKAPQYSQVGSRGIGLGIARLTGVSGR